MADCQSIASPAQTILYLRPQNSQSIATLDLDGNKPYLHKVPPPDTTDIPLDGTSDNHFTSHLSPRDIASRETTPGLYAICPRVFRLGFDSTQKPSPLGFTFGSRSKSNSNSIVKIPYYPNKRSDGSLEYFRIHYNFNSGALLITAIDTIRVGTAILGKHESILLMAGITIYCGGVFEFAVEFPELSNCAKDHEQNYLEYAAKLGVPNAPYLPTSPDGDVPIGREHVSKAILGKGTFGEVHKAVKIKDGQSFAVKILSDGGDDELKEENIIKYEGAFKLPSNQICIVMELAVNDLHTHQTARETSRQKSYLSLQCIQSIGWQSLSALAYLHSMGITHRDMKPTNILVTKWDAHTDTPTIKLADFGLAGITSETSMHRTFCGTKGYVAPEVIQAYKRLEEVRGRRDKGMKTVPMSRVLRYDNSVDIWALGKILQDLVDAVPSYILRRGRPISMSKRPAVRLIDRMMLEDPKRRPTAAECLQDPWMAIYNCFDDLQAQKRDRSPTPSIPSPTPSTGQPLRKVIRRAYKDSAATEEGPPIRIASAIWLDESSEHQDRSSQAPHGASSPSDIEMEDRSLIEQKQISHDRRLTTQLTIRLTKDSRPSVTAYGHNGRPIPDSPIAQDENIPLAILADSIRLQETSPSMQDAARKLLADHEGEGYSNNVTIAGNNADVGIIRNEIPRLGISRIQIGRESETSVMLRLEFNNEEWTSRFWSEGQCSANRNIEPPGPVNQDNTTAAGDASRRGSCLQVTFSQVGSPSLLNERWARRQEPVGILAKRLINWK
ncbi:MAG: hypothetical protein Q9217_006746 [Psora testacea]